MKKLDIMNHPDFLKDDPVSIIHNFQLKMILKYLVYDCYHILGRRKSIIKCAKNHKIDG